MPNTKKNTVKTILPEVMRDLLHQKSFNKISVNELCQTASISRSSFYANFRDKYDLLSYCLNEQRGKLESLFHSHSAKDLLTIMLNLIQEESRFFYHAFGDSFDEEVGEIFYNFFSEPFNTLLQEKIQQGATFLVPVEYVSAFYIGGLSSMILRWIKSNYSISKEELATCQYQLLKDFIE